MISNRSTSWLSVVVAVLAVLFVSSTATAGEQEAREFNKQAKAAYNAGNFEKAASLLEKAYNEDPNVVYQYNRVRALEGAKEFDKALEVLAKYRDEMRQKGYSDLPQLKETLEKKRARKQSNDKDSTAKGDGGQTGSSGTPGAMSDPSGPSGPSGPPSDTGGGVKPTPLTWALFGIGGASLIGGGLLSTGLFVDKSNTDAVKSQQLTAAVLLGTGALAGVAGGLTLLLNKPSGGSANNQTGASGNSGPAVRVSPMVGPGGGGAILDVRF